MKSHEKGAFWRFFLIYFASVALLITVSGYFYFRQQKEALVSHEQFSIIWYARMLKTTGFAYTKEGFTYEIVERRIERFDPQNLKITPCCIEKIVPSRQNGRYILVKKDRKEFDRRIDSLIAWIVAVQIVLLLLFALISMALAQISLRPMREAIVRLDRFAKDLIHDLNTPVTSILLNLRLLKKDRSCTQKRELQRIETSANEIAALYRNLNILLEEETFKTTRFDLCPMLDELAEHYRLRFPDLAIELRCGNFVVTANAAAMKQVLHNLLTNACKYNRKNGNVEIWTRGKRLFIKDGGHGIEHVEKIFQRHYKESESGSGIGLHIVKTLCDAMGIEITAESRKGIGTVVTLEFP